MCLLKVLTCWDRYEHTQTQSITPSQRGRGEMHCTSAYVMTIFTREDGWNTRLFFLLSSITINEISGGIDISISA